MVSSANTPPDRYPDEEQVHAHFSVLSRPGEVREVRVLEYTLNGRYRSTAAGYFDNADAVVKAIREIGARRAKGIYITQNAVDPRLLARAYNRLEPRAKQTTADADIPHYQHLTFDIDPRRPSGISSTDAERDLAVEVRERFVIFVRELGWPEPVVAMMSGNGAMVTYRIDEPTDAAGRSLIARVLAAADELVSTADVSVDTALSNPARIIKLCGTVAAKGDPTAERPYRRASGTFLHGAHAISKEQLAAFAALVPDSVSSRSINSTASRTSFDIPALLDGAGIGYTLRKRAWGTVFELNQCLSSLDHSDGAAILQFPSGAIAYKCHHNRCAGIGWQDIKSQLGLSNESIEVDKPEVSTAREKRQQTEIGPANPGTSLILRRMDTVEAREVDWLWYRWLARGKLTILGGHGGDGKSTMTAWLAALLSCPGSTFPDGAPAPLTNTLFLLAEDSLDDVLRPRLDLMGAEPSRIHAIEAVMEAGRERLFNLERHLPLLEEAIDEHDIGLVVIDPVTSFMAGGDRNNEGDVRDTLTPLSKMAERTGAAVQAVMHVGKPNGTQRRPVQQLLGSTAFGAIARTVWMTIPDPSDPNKVKRVLGVVKSNLASVPDSLVWSRLEDRPILWHGRSVVPVSDLFTNNSASSGSAAEALLREALAGGMRVGTEIKDVARDQGITEKMLRTARDRLGVHVFRDPENPKGQWFWALPADHVDLSDAPDAHGISRSSGASDDIEMRSERREEPHIQMPYPTSGHWATEDQRNDEEVVTWSA